MPRSTPVMILGAALLATAADARPRHEYVSPAFLRQYDPARVGRTALSGAGALPDALPRGDEALPPPPAGGPGADPLRSPDEARPDRRTTPDAGLRYQVVFNPTVVPLRRNVAFNAIDAGLRLTVASGPLRPVAVGPRQLTPGHEAFWGDVTLDLQGGEARLPSVAPTMRVLALEPTPKVQVQVLRDDADNFYVRAGHTGPLRLRFLVEAPPEWFGHPLPDHVAVGVGQGLADTALPPALAARARRVLARIGVAPDQSFRAGVHTLVAWFRAFEAGPPPEDRGDLYAELALGQVGVCRHRAFAFFVTARAAGIPTRYVQNEAHAFIEIRAPDGRWRRVDLGGEAPELSIDAQPEHRLHTPPPDGLPQPAAYQAQYSAQVGQATEQVRDAPPPVRGADGTGAGGEGPPAAQPTREASIPLPAEGEAAAPEGEGGQPAAPVRLTLAPQAAAQVFRGDPLPFVAQGRLTDAAGVGLAGRRIQLFLLPASGRGPVPVGAPVVTGAEGRFQRTLRVPGTLGPGAYTLVAASEAGGGFAAGRSAR